MAISDAQLEEILAPIISRLIRLEEIVETEISTSNERTFVDVVNDLGEIKNPVNNSIAVNRADGVIYYYDSSGGWQPVL